MNQLRFTPAITFVVHTAISILVGAIVAGLTALMQVIFTSSDPRVILATSVSAFLAWFTHGFVSLAKAPETAQAGADALSEVKDIVAQHTQAISNLQALAAPAPVAPQPPVQQFVQPAPQPQFAFQPTTTYPTLPTVAQ